MNFFKVNKPVLQPKAGRVLIAEPGLDIDFFKRSVILLTECGDASTIGFILNKTIELPLDIVIENFHGLTSQINIGGPVETDSLFFIHTLGSRIPESQHISKSIYWGGDFRILSQLLYNNEIKESQIRFFLGYSGWTEGQLETEIAQDTWVVLDLEEPDIMAYNADLWTKSVTKMGDSYKLWLNYPEDPQLN